jgi:GNAT superfamily N-acetyltransferase
VIVVRAARPDEYAHVGALTIGAYRSLAADHLWGGYENGIMDTATRAKGADILVADIDGRVIGSVTFVSEHSSSWSEWTLPGEAQFRLLAVDPEARGRGVGEVLVRACLDRARTAGQPVIIHTTPWMETARRMYERLGLMRRPDRDVPYEQWNADTIEGLPNAWIGQSFLAYSTAAR